MSDHAATAWSPDLFSLVLPHHAAAPRRIMQQLHDHANTSLVNSFVYKAWWGKALREHKQPCDLQLGINVTDWLIPSPPYVNQSANTQVWYTKIPGEEIRILGLFSSLTIMGVRMQILNIPIFLTCGWWRHSLSTHSSIDIAVYWG